MWQCFVEIHFGSLVHMFLLCFSELKKYENTLKNSERNIQFFNIRTKFQKEMTILHRPQKELFSSNILHECWKLVYVCAQFLKLCSVYIFLILKKKNHIHQGAKKTLSNVLRIYKLQTCNYYTCLVIIVFRDYSITTPSKQILQFFSLSVSEKKRVGHLSPVLKNTTLMDNTSVLNHIIYWIQTC